MRGFEWGPHALLRIKEVLESARSSGKKLRVEDMEALHRMWCRFCARLAGALEEAMARLPTRCKSRTGPPAVLSTGRRAARGICRCGVVEFGARNCAAP